MKKLQASYLSYILLAGVVISLATAAILWGQPLLTKNKIKSEVNNLENFVISLANTIDKSIYEKQELFSNANAYLEIFNNTIVITYSVPNNFIYSPNLKDVPLNIIEYKKYAINEPTCVINLTTEGNLIVYEISCRIHYDPITKRCYNISLEDLPSMSIFNKRIIIEKVGEKVYYNVDNCTILKEYKIRISVT